MATGKTSAPQQYSFPFLRLEKNNETEIVMRKSVKFAAASVLAAVAMAGGSATAASAHDHDDEGKTIVLCDNDQKVKQLGNDFYGGDSGNVDVKNECVGGDNVYNGEPNLTEAPGAGGVVGTLLNATVGATV